MKHNFLLVCEDAKTQENIFDGYIFNPFTTVQRFDNFDKFKQTTKFMTEMTSYSAYGNRMKLMAMEIHL